MKKTTATLALAAALFAGLAAAHAAPVISRLTPPSALFSFNSAGAPYISRFLVGQYFDLQVTASPDAGQTISGVQFLVDGNPVSATDPLGNPIAYSPPVTTGLVAGKPAGTAVLSFRHYAHLTPGAHTAIITQSDAQTKTATGNFEIVATPNLGRKAKNIIIMIGDGMGASHRTAARIVKTGVQQGKAIAPLAMDLFPVTGMVETASLNSIVTDSAPGAACYSTGNKSNNNQQGVFPDDTTNNGDNPRVELIGEDLARTQGKSLGIVTTADVFDATPAAFGSHTQARSAGTGICDYYLDEAVPKANLAVLLGGGRKWFLPSAVTGSARTSGTDYGYPADVNTGWGVSNLASPVTRDLLADFQTAGFTYAPDRTALNSIAPGTTKLVGLFTLSNMNIAMDKIAGRRGTSTITSDYGFPDQPTLDEMTDKALQVLKTNPNGFVLMIEGASIDKQAHNMDTERWILDTVEFDYAVEKVRQFATNAANGETLALITADHECAGVAIIGASTLTNAALQTRAGLGGGKAQLRDAIIGTGTATAPQFPAVVGTYESAGFRQYSIQADGYPASMDVDFKMLIGYAANADRNEDWLTNPLPLRDSQQPQAALPLVPINGVAIGNPAVITSNAHGLTNNTVHVIAGVTGAGATVVNGTFTVTVIDANTFTVPVNAAGNSTPNTGTVSSGATSYGSIVLTLPNLPADRDLAGAFAITGQVADTVAAHTAGDVPLSAIGRGAKLFTGYQDNTDVFFKTMQAAIGGAAN